MNTEEDYNLTTRYRNYLILFFICILTAMFIGFYYLEHFVPYFKDQTQANAGNLKLIIELFWFAAGYFFLFRYMPGIIKRNAYFWGGAIIVLTALVIMTENLSIFGFMDFARNSFGEIESCFAIFIGTFFMFKGYLYNH